MAGGDGAPQEIQAPRHIWLSLPVLRRNFGGPAGLHFERDPDAGGSYPQFTLL